MEENGIDPLAFAFRMLSQAQIERLGPDLEGKIAKIAVKFSHGMTFNTHSPAVQLAE